MTNLANRLEDIISRKFCSTHCFLRLIAVGSFLMLLTIPIQADISSTLKTTLLEKAIAQNLAYQSVSFSHASESKSSASNPQQQIISVNASLRLLLILPIRLHREVITHQDGDVCSFQPSCSRYSLAVIRRYGIRGLLMASNRLLRCHSGSHKYYPVFQGSAYDPVP